MALDIQLEPRGAVVNLDTQVNAETTQTGAAWAVHRIPAILPESILLRSRLNVVNAGVPTLDVDVEDSFDGTNWNVLHSFATQVTAGEIVAAPARVPGPFIRAVGTIGGTTPDIDYQVDVVGLELA